MMVDQARYAVNNPDAPFYNVPAKYLDYSQFNSIRHVQKKAWDVRPTLQMNRAPLPISLHAQEIYKLQPHRIP
ncbi:hypothetical protein F4808DRAFT_409299 [Astrocystis sublimbata]|nr:hypothetical protein F4808DRAFT_409299 [Astrocystis sublimbata]